jgi:hypothetical protein
MFFSGLDLGQAADFTALVITGQRPAEKPTPRRRWRYDVRHLQAWPLGTDYTVIADDVAALFARKPIKYTKLGVDYTGVGRPVVDQLRSAQVTAHIRPILITGGDKVTHDPNTNEFHVPKRELVGTLIALMQSELVAIPDFKVDDHSSPERKEMWRMKERLRKELKDFKTKLSRRSANEQFGAWADGQHDDLVLALMLAVWLGERLGPGDATKVHVPSGDEATVTGTAPPGVFLGGNEW